MNERWSIIESASEECMLLTKALIVTEPLKNGWYVGKQGSKPAQALSLSLSSRKVRRKKKGSASSYLARTRGGRPVGERREGGVVSVGKGRWILILRGWRRFRECLD